MASSKELKALITLAGKIDPSLQTALMKASKLSNNVSNGAKKSASSLSKVGEIAKGVFVGNLMTMGIEKIGDGLIETAKSGLKLASDLTEVQNVVDTTFGSNANQINDWATKAGSSFGISELQAKQFTGTLGAMMKSSGITGNNLTKMSEKLTGLSGDLASFYNLSTDDAFEKIKSGISGETEPLKALGINMSVANLNAYALSKGLTQTYDKMDQASQTALRYGYLMKVSKDAQGDFAKTQGSFANQQRLLKMNFEQLASKIMEKVLPSLTKIMEFGNNFITSLNVNSIQDSFGKIIAPFERIGKIAYDVGQTAYQAIQDNKPQIDIVIDKVQRLGDKIFSAFDSAQPTIDWFTKNGIPLAIDVVSQLLDGATGLYDFINDNWDHIADIVVGITTALGLYKLATDGVKLATELATGAQLLFNAAMDMSPVGQVCMVLGILATIAIEVYQHWGEITQAVSDAWDKFRSFIEGRSDLELALTGPLAPILLLIKHFKELSQFASDAYNGVKNFFGLGSGNSTPTTTDVGSVQLHGVNRFANGGIASKASIFGEDGPEMAIPLKRTSRNLGLLNQTAQILGAGSQGSQGSGVQIDYSPTIIGGNKEDILPILNQHKEDIRSMVEDIINGGGRVSFG